MGTALSRYILWTIEVVAEISFISGALVLVVSFMVGKPLITTCLAMIGAGALALVLVDRQVLAAISRFVTYRIRLRQRLAWVRESCRTPRKGW